MNYLHDLINVLKDSELEQVRSLELPQRQRNVLDTMLGFRHRELPENSEIMKALDISLPHFYKVNSVLLDKCYEIFAPGRGLKILEFLTLKNLFRHFCHEAMLQEKDLLQYSPDEIESFYLRCFVLSQAFPAKYYDENLSRSFGEKYLSSRKSKENDDEIYVDVRLLYTKIITASVRGANNPEAQVIYHQLEKHAQLLVGSVHALALYSHYQGFAAYYTYYQDAEKNAEKILYYLLKADSVCDKFHGILNSGQKSWTQGKIAEAYYAGSNFLKAFELYEEIFKNGGIERQKQFYHATKFAQICIILDKLTRAGEILKENFGIYIASREQTVTTMAAISYAKLYLSSGEFLKAKEFIDLGFELNTKNYYVQYEIELRNLQNTYFFLKEDWETAEDFARRNLKFLTSKGFTLETSAYGHFYKMVLAFINMKLHKAKFPENLEERFAQYQQSYFAVYGKLLKIMREKAEGF